MNSNSYLDMLAWLGEGSAHPGGFGATVELLKGMDLEPSMKLLDVGCGTGRTSCHAAITYDCHVTGIDLHPLMIKKAKKRARRIGVNCSFVQGDALNMPMEDQQFDRVLAESVVVFTPFEKIIKELYRVTKPGGKVVNLELCQFRAVPLDAMRTIFGIERIPKVKEWLEIYRQAGFRQVRIISKRKPFTLEKMLENEQNYPDQHRLESSKVQIDKRIKQSMAQASYFLRQYADKLGYMVLEAER